MKHTLRTPFQSARATVSAFTILIERAIQAVAQATLLQGAPRAVVVRSTRASRRG